jgi:hypothetical protein
MRTLRNLTLHEQNDAECAIAARAGFSLLRTPEGAVVEPGEAGLARASTQLADRLRSCTSQNEAVLIGGHTGALLAAVLILLARNEPFRISGTSTRAACMITKAGLCSARTSGADSDFIGSRERDAALIVGELEDRNSPTPPCNVWTKKRSTSGTSRSICTSAEVVRDAA